MSDALPLLVDEGVLRELLAEAFPAYRLVTREGQADAIDRVVRSLRRRLDRERAKAREGPA